MGATFCIALLLRLAFAVLEGLNESPCAWVGREKIRRHLCLECWPQGNGYRGMSPDVTDQNHLTAYRTPLPSVLWAGFYAILGHRYDIINVLHCLLGAAAVLLVYEIGPRMFDPTVGLVSAGIYAVFPNGHLSLGRARIGTVGEPFIPVVYPRLPAVC